MTTAWIEEAVQTKGDLPGHPFRGNQWGGGQVSEGGMFSEMPSDRADQVYEDTEAWMGKLDPDVVGIIDDYIGDGHKVLNGKLRQGPEALSKEDKRTAKTIDDAMVPLQGDATLFRGVDKSTWDSLYADLGEGDTIRDRAFTSTSLAKNTAGGFASGGTIEIAAPKGTMCLPVAGIGEMEILLPRGMEMKVVGVDKDRKVISVVPVSQGSRQPSGNPSEGWDWSGLKKSPSRLAILHKALQITTQAVRLKQLLLKDQLRNAVVKAVHLKQYAETEAELTDAMEGLIKRQFKEASKSVKEDGSTKFNPRDWDDDLVNTALPILMKKAGEAAAAQMLLMGLDIAPKGKRTKGDLPGHPFRGNQWTDGADSGSSEEEKDGSQAATEKVLQFHGTLEKNLQSILSDGIVPSADKRFAESSQGDRGSKVFSTGSLAVADWYGKTAALYAPEGSKYAVFEIEVPKDAMQSAARDMSSADSWMFDKIPPEWIKAVHIGGERRQLTKAISKGVYVPLVFSSEKKSPSRLTTKSFQTKASRATEWLLNLDDADIDTMALWPEVFTLPSGLTVDLGFATEWPDWMKAEISKQMKECFEQPFWAGINDTTAKGIQSHVLKGIEEGLSIREIREQMVGDGLDEYYHNRGINIARTECLPADTVVNGANVLCAHKRWYSGPWVEVITKAGRKFSGTPNHPMLTKRGMVAIGDLVETDDLVCHRFNVEQAGLTGNENVEHPPTTIGQVFDSLAAVGVVERRRCTQPDFHGDGVDGYVDIFHSNGPLLYGSHSPIDKSIIHLILPEAGMGEGGLPTGSSEADGFVSSVDSRLGSVAKIPSALGDDSLNGCGVDVKDSSQLRTGFSSLIPSSDFRTGEILGTGSIASIKHQLASGLSVSPRDSEFLASSENDALVTTENLSHFDHAEPRLIEFDHPLVIRRIESWSGHVYNLTTVEGYFIIADGVYTGNSGSALNGARSAAMDRLSEEVPGLKTKKMWMSVLGTTTRDSHAHLDGVPADRDGMWYLGGVKVPWPGHWNLPAGERCNCQCTLTTSWGQSDEAASELIEEYNQRLNEERRFRAWVKTQSGLEEYMAREKGDLPGHPFRGNQWSGGRAGADSGSSGSSGLSTVLDVLTGKQPPNAATAVRRIDQTSVKSDNALGKGGVNTTRIVEIEDENGTVNKYCFKPDDGENPGVHPAFRGHQSSNEVAASVIDEAMGLGMVAKTEMVEIDGKKGSLQKWVNDDAKVADELIEWKDDMVKDSSKADNAEGVADMMYFDALIGNHDRHINNWLVKDGKVKLIDNGMSMADNMEYGDISFRTMEHAGRARAMTKMTPKFKTALDKLIASKEQTDVKLREAGVGATQRESFWKRAEYLRKAKMIGFGDSTLQDLGRLAEGKQLF